MSVKSRMVSIDCSAEAGKYHTKKGTLCFLTLFCLILFGLDSAWAIDFPDLLSDPLFVRPSTLDSGAVLPGDHSPAPCLENVDLRSPLSLSRAVDIALCNNPKIKASWAAIKVEVGAVGEAKAAYLPTLSGTLSPMSTQTAYPGSAFPTSNINGNAASASFTWRLFDFGGRSANLEMSTRLMDAAMASHDATLQKSLTEVIQAYFDVMTTKSDWFAAMETVRIAQETLNETKKRETKGIAPISDTLQATAALANATLQQQRAEGDYRKAHAVLIQTLGIAVHSDVNVPNTLDEFHSDSSKELEAWLTETELRHPAIKEAQAQLAAAKSKVLSLRSGGLPTIDFSANYYKNAYPGQGLQTLQTNVSIVGLVLTIPIFDGFSRTYKIRGAQAQVEQKEAELMDAEHRVLTEVVKAYADSVSSLNNLEASKSLLDAEGAVLASSRRRYDKGDADILELLKAEASLSDAKRERIRCLAEWHSARFRLMANSGILDRALVTGN